jgi:hypothetical protein
VRRGLSAPRGVSGAGALRRWLVVRLGLGEGGPVRRDLLAFKGPTSSPRRRAGAVGLSGASRSRSTGHSALGARGGRLDPLGGDTGRFGLQDGAGNAPDRCGASGGELLTTKRPGPRGPRPNEATRRHNVTKGVTGPRRLAQFRHKPRGGSFSGASALNREVIRDVGIRAAPRSVPTQMRAEPQCITFTQRRRPHERGGDVTERRPANPARTTSRSRPRRRQQEAALPRLPPCRTHTAAPHTESGSNTPGTPASPHPPAPMSASAPAAH